MGALEKGQRKGGVAEDGQENMTSALILKYEEDFVRQSGVRRALQTRMSRRKNRVLGRQGQGTLMIKFDWSQG